MSDILSRILGGVLGGGQAPAQQPPRNPLGFPDEAGRSGGLSLPGGGSLGGMAGGGGSSAGGLGGLLGGLLGGARTGGAFGGSGLRNMALMALLAWLMRGRGGAQGLASLTERLRGAGLGHQVDSWVGPGDNSPVSPDELARAFDPQDLDAVSRETGVPQEELLSQLSRGLPGLVDRMSPQGRLPERDEDLPDADEDEILGGFGAGRRG